MAIVKFSQATGGVYPARAYEDFPPDALDIPDAVYARFQGGEISGFSVVAGKVVAYVAPTPTLADLKSAKNAEINAWRLKVNRSTFTHAGKVFACDELSRSDIDGANGMIANLGAMPPGWPGGWKAVDNTVLPIATVADWKAFYGSMFASGNANFIHAQDLKTALAAATTAAQVAAIVW